MGGTNFSNGVLSYGIPLIGSGPVLTTGTVFFVDVGHSGRGDAANYGTKDNPFATLDYAIGRCTANNGDFIIVAPGHTETVIAAAGIDFDTAGITILGLGNGTDRPTVTFTTSTLADVDIDAANIRISNIIFTVGVDSPTAVIDVNAANFQLDHCLLLGTASYQVDSWITLDGAADYSKILYNEIIDVTAGASDAIRWSAAIVDLEIAYNRIYGDYSNACIYSVSDATQLNIHHNDLTNLQAGDHCIELKTGTQTGVIAYNIVNNTSLADAGTKGAIDPGSCFCIENYGSRNTADISGVLNPTVDT